MNKRIIKERGITLVALIITIIILIILAVVTIFVLYNHDIFGLITGSVDEYVAKEGEEKKNFDETDEMIAKTIEKINSATSEETQFTEEEMHLMRGKIIEYKPNTKTFLYLDEDGNPTDDSSKETYYKYSGNTSNNTAFTTEDFNWRIWSVNNKEIVLIADGVTSNKLYLLGHAGYNNGVKLQNDICKTCYSNEELGAVARNLNIEDIENVLDLDVWDPTSYNFGNCYTYTTSKKYTNYRAYPQIYSLEQYSGWGDEMGEHKNSNEVGITRSEQSQYYEGSVTASNFIEPTQTAWQLAATENNFKDKRYYDMIFKNSSTNEGLGGYWLSSRAINANDVIIGLYCHYHSGGVDRLAVACSNAPGQTYYRNTVYISKNL